MSNYIPDYIDASFVLRNSRYVSSNIVKGRRIVLYNIGISITQDGDEPLRMCVEFPRLVPLIDLIKANPDHDTYRYTDDVWHIAS